MVESYRKTFEKVDLVEPVQRESCTEYVTLVDDVDDGKVCKRASFVIDDARTRHAGLKPSDFALENQIAAGVQLKPCNLSLSTLPYADRIAFEASKIAEFVKSNSKNE